MNSLGHEAVQQLDVALGDRYQLVRELGQGAMAVVFLARDLRHSRQVAIKVLKPELAHALGTERFLREIEIAAQLNHPHILSLHDSGEAAGFLYYVMPYVEGESLRSRLDREQQLPLEDAVQIARDVGDALAHAHSLGVIHRDIKPENILLRAGHAVVSDFGIARVVSALGDGTLTQTGMVVGTPVYMSPEQSAGSGQVDGRTDIYALGCILYEMLAGEKPFSGPNLSALLARKATEPAPSIRMVRDTVPKSIERVIQSALARLPVDRATAAQFVQALDTSRATLGEPAPPANHRARPSVLAALLVIALGGGWWTYRAIRDREPGALALKPDPDLVLILPFTPTTPDSTLTRVGRDLAVTLSTALDGLGELHTVDAATVLARSASWDAETAPQAGLALAREVGAGRIVFGSLVSGAGIARSDVTVHHTIARAADARVAAVAPVGDIAALTDSITFALLRDLWPSERTPDSPPSALSRSLPALRAFLEGELATAENRWRQAPDLFARAFAIDSTFWLAYWRYVEAMSFRGRPIDPAVLAVVQAHRADLPERERALIESRLADSLSDRLQRARAVTDRYPDSWRAWFGLADQLIHNTIFLGTTVAEARSAIERAAALNPGSTTNWTHVFWMTLSQSDSSGTAKALDHLARLGHDSASLQEVGLNELRFFRYLQHLANHDGRPDSAMADSLAEPLVRYTGLLNLEAISGETSVYGFHRGEIELAQHVLNKPVPASARTGALRATAQAWAGRGDWDSALVAMHRYVDHAEDATSLQHAYRLAAVGEWLGTLEPGSADAWRTGLTRERARLSSVGLAELAWLDGIRSYARRDERALAEAQRRLVATDTLTAPMLGRSLHAFRLALNGRTAEAADTLLELERYRSERYLFTIANTHPYLTAVNRLAAADWLMLTGRAAEVPALLRWHDAVQFPATLAARADASLRGLIHYKRGRAEQELGQVDAARSHFLRALREYDHPVRPLQPLLDTARATLQLEPGRAR